MPTPRAPSIRDSWPPTQVLLRSSIEPPDADAEIDDLDLSYLDKDPLSYFLTPPAPYTEEEDDDDLADDAYDAGIEDATHPPPIVRSVSPSTLDGLKRPEARPPTPPLPSSGAAGRASPSPDPDVDMLPTPEYTTDDDNREEYIRLDRGAPPLLLGLPFSLRDFAAAKSRMACGRKGSAREPKTAAEGLLSPTSQPHASARGRSAFRPGSRPVNAAPPPAAKTAVRYRGVPAGRSSPRAWRGPSPDVWSIEEEPEEEMVEEKARGGEGVRKRSEGAAVDGAKAAKPRKKVRFVLPPREM